MSYCHWPVPCSVTRRARLCFAILSHAERRRTHAVLHVFYSISGIAWFIRTGACKYQSWMCAHACGGRKMAALSLCYYRYPGSDRTLLIALDYDDSINSAIRFLTVVEAVCQFRRVRYSL